MWKPRSEVWRRTSGSILFEERRTSNAGLSCREYIVVSELEDLEDIRRDEVEKE